MRVVAIALFAMGCNGGGGAPDASADVAVDVAPVLHPLIGVDYTHDHATLSGDGILLTYQKAGTRSLVQSQLAAMYAGGARTTRMIVWNTHDIGTNDWGVIPSYDAIKGAGIFDPYRANLIQYLTDLKASGFTRLTIAFAPAGANDPKENYGATCNATFFDTNDQSTWLEENWTFMQQVRALAKQYGPLDVRFDLLNEGAPYDWLDGNCSSAKSVKTQTRKYDTQIVARWVQAFGGDDFTLSAMIGALLTCESDGGAPSFDTTTLVGSLGELVSLFGATPPKWFAVHAYYPGDPKCAPVLSQSVLASLLVADAFLASKQLTAPFVVQETYYDDNGVAGAVASFMQKSSRPIDELMEWPLTAGSTAGIDVEPPYSVSAYLPLQK